MTARGPYSLGKPEVENGYIQPWPAQVSPTLYASFGDKQGLENQHALNGGGLFVPVPMVNLQGSKGNSVAQEDGPSFTLNAMHGHDVHAVVVPTITATNDPSRSPQSSEATQPVAWSIMPQNSGRDYKARQVDVLQPLLAAGVQYGNQGGDIIQSATQVRRLTPTECERLQGFPDGYTAIPLRGRPASECPDGPRYKSLGNSMAVPVMSWIGHRINSIERMGG